jgi:hypothetical protein
MSMGWQAVHDEHKKKYDGYIVVCEDRYEREYIIKLILKQFPQLDRSSVEGAVDTCGRLVPSPRPRDKYVECLRLHLPQADSFVPAL